MYRIVLNETSYYGAGCRSVIAEEVRKRGFRKALLVTDKDLIRFGVAEKIERVLADAGIPYEIYSEIKANPTIRNVQQGVEAFKRSGADFMVALGGVLWYSQFFGLGMGKSFFAEAPLMLAFSWSILMSLNVLFSNLWGILLHEWRGVDRRTAAVLVTGLLILIFSTVYPQLVK